MSKWILAAGAAAFAVAAPAMAQQHGNGHGKSGHDQQHGNGGAMKDQMKGQAKGKGHDDARPMVKAEAKGHAMADKGHGKSLDDRGRGAAHVAVDRSGRIDVRDLDRGDHRYPRLAADRGLVEGCPPGLAMKGDGCMPPGQFKKIGERLAADARTRALVGPYSQWYRDNDRYTYRMGDGVLYQVNRSNGLIDALIPYGMQNYSYYPVGYSYPDLYNSYNIPYAYRSFYPDSSDYLYRYGGNAIYAVNPQTNLISSIVSLLAGDLSVGQPLPSAYNVYNVPMAYRGQYYDTPDAWYRYNDGYIYRVDPTTQLVTAAINALT